MRSVLEAIRAHPFLRLQIIVTGMHLDRSRGYSLKSLAKEGFAADAVVPWPPLRGTARVSDQTALAQRTGNATAGIAAALERLKTDVVLVVGDRVEAFAGAAAGYIAGRIVAHIHGGDRALGQVDDTLRHAITKLSHLHFPATPGAARRLRRLGEDPRRIILAGSPGIDNIKSAAVPRSGLQRLFGRLPPREYALFVLHPTENDARKEAARARLLLAQTLAAGVKRIVVIYPNNDPGSAGIAQVLAGVRDPRIIVRRDIDRPTYLALLRDAAFLIGNSSSGIIEAASFRTPVVDVGPRQLGREHGKNVVHADFDAASIARALAKLWDKRRGIPREQRQRTASNPYGSGHAGRTIAAALARVPLDASLRQKLIAY
jgi:UDP-hydrolysing UDP-N-acetyl-D-glucosamine 2-epimerase